MSHNPQHSFVITGVKTGISPQTGPPPRLEISELINNKMVFSLYIQALMEMMSPMVSQNDPLSHFQIGGIHGKPYIRWDSSGAARPATKSWGGYCTHGNVLFPTWHRPYLALYEQALHRHVVDIAKLYTGPDRAEWQAAAEAFRIPYWDWSSHSVPPDELIFDPIVFILKAPKGERDSVLNPLLGYAFHNVDQGRFDSPWNVWARTLRCPTTEEPNAKSNPFELRDNLTGADGRIGYQLKHMTYMLMVGADSYLDMSNHSKNVNYIHVNSIEAIHDNIHGYFGGLNGGHMGDPTVAGMDPMFFILHASCDRLLALWQAIHHESWIPESTANHGSWTIKAQSKVDAETPLMPFWNGPTTYWNSNAVRDFRVLGYTYPEFVDQDPGDALALADHIKNVVNNLYGFKFPGSMQEDSMADSTNEAPQAVLRSIKSTAAKLTPMQRQLQFPSPPIPIIFSHQARDWVVRIQCMKFQLGGSYSVFVFLGPIPDDPLEWRMSHSLLGTKEVFANSSGGECANCKSNSELVTESFIHLNQAIATSGLSSFHPDDVVSYLKGNLSWRVLQHGKEVALSRCDSLQVTVFSTVLDMEVDDKFPEMGKASHHHEVTSGQPGGHRA